MIALEWSTSCSSAPDLVNDEGGSKAASLFVSLKSFNLSMRYATLLLDVDCQSGSQLSCKYHTPRSIDHMLIKLETKIFKYPSLIANLLAYMMVATQ